MKQTSASGNVTVFNGNEKTEASRVLVGERLEPNENFKPRPAPGARSGRVNGKPAVAAP